MVAQNPVDDHHFAILGVGSSTGGSPSHHLFQSIVMNIHDLEDLAGTPHDLGTLPSYIYKYIIIY